MKLSEHFTLDEAIYSHNAIRWGIDNTPGPVELENMRAAAEHMEAVRAVLGDRPIDVSSWYRCPELDARVGGSESPRGHRSGWCIDWACPDFGTPLECCRALVAAGMQFDQLIYEIGWVHTGFAPPMRQEVRHAVFRRGERTIYPLGLE